MYLVNTVIVAAIPPFDFFGVELYATAIPVRKAENEKSTQQASSSVT
jgi:hypothetical protein